MGTDGNEARCGSQGGDDIILVCVYYTYIEPGAAVEGGDDIILQLTIIL